MRKIVVIALVAAALAVSGTAMAGLGGLPGSVPGSVKGAATQAVSKGAEMSINKDLNKYTCEWNATSKQIGTCKKGNKNVDFNAIAGVLSSGRALAESQGGRDFEINVHTQDYKAFDITKGKLKSAGVGGWDINRETSGVAAGQIKFSVLIK